MLGRLLKIYGIINRTFGFTLRPLFTGWLILSYQLFTRLTLLCDNVIFRGYRKQPIERPIFIVGNPRSGTTFLHRFLHRCGSVCSFELWQMIIPSILGQKLLRPLVGPLARLNPARHHGSEAHQTGLDSLETDDVALFFRYLDGLFLYGYFLCWDEDDHLQAMIDSLEPDSAMNRRDLAYYTSILRRSLHRTRKPRVLGKLFTFPLRIDDVLRAYPDARLIYMVRDPLSVIPSGMNMLKNVLEKQYHISTLDESVRRRYFDRLYQGEVQLFQRFLDVYKSGRIPEENLMIVRFPDLMERFEEVMERIEAFCGLTFSEEYKQQINATADKQRAHKSKHSYDLESFWLTEEQIRKDLAGVYETFDL